MPGPLPKTNARRRNAPTIPTTDLPAAGWKGPMPAVPAGYELGESGSAWWAWAWRTPQAAAWSPGDLYGELQVAREARELDDRLGLTPKGLAALRWKIVAPISEVPRAQGAGRERLKAVR
jgi:hypothetical protein